MNRSISILVCFFVGLHPGPAMSQDVEPSSADRQPPPSARPEITTNLAIGGGVVILPGGEEENLPDDSPRGVFRFGANTSVTFLRASNREFGFGLYSEIMTSTFRDVMPGAGLSFLFPLHHAAPLILWTGAHYDYDGTHAGGFSGRLWWGAHNHNHFRVYNVSFGLWVEVRANIWGNRDVVVSGGIDIDLSVLVTPWLWFASWARGPGRL